MDSQTNVQKRKRADSTEDTIAIQDLGESPNSQPDDESLYQSTLFWSTQRILSADQEDKLSLGIPTVGHQMKGAPSSFLGTRGEYAPKTAPTSSKGGTTQWRIAKEEREAKRLSEMLKTPQIIVPKRQQTLNFQPSPSIQPQPSPSIQPRTSKTKETEDDGAEELILEPRLERLMGTTMSYKSV